MRCCFIFLAEHVNNLWSNSNHAFKKNRDDGHAPLLPYILIIEIFCIVHLLTIREENSFVLKYWEIS